MRFMTDPFGHVPARTQLEVRHRGGIRHGGDSTQEQRDYDRWWRKKVSEILRSS